MDKRELRIWAKNRRKELNIERVSSILTEELVNRDEYLNSKNIMLFYPLEHEINLLSLLDDKSKNFYLPRINGDILECCRYSKGDELCKSCFKTQEPVCKACDKNKIDLVIVPALACDIQGYRLGYGGGFYDRFLEDFGGIKITCIPKELIVETVFPEKYDVRLDLILHS